MTNVLITGGRGFLGRNLAAHLGVRTDCQTWVFDQEDSHADLTKWLNAADVVFHLAGVNRPDDPAEYKRGNAGFTAELCDLLRAAGKAPKIVFASSIQAALENPYGVSKRIAEETLLEFSVSSGACVRIYRLKNLFGKWCRPNYNSVTATFCHNVAHDLPISISDPVREMELSYVDDVVAAFVGELELTDEPATIRSETVRLGALAERIQSFRRMRNTLKTPDLADWFTRALYATYLSYVPAEGRQQQLSIRADERGSLAEFIKSDHFGQIFVSRTRPGVTRGNHYHHTKAEKFLVVEGDGLIRMRAIEGGPVEEYLVRGSEYRVVDIPPGMTHSISNIGNTEMVTIFWSDEMFDPSRPDTHYLPVGGTVTT
jgi:UDP-2-acetamido-2,6-beta-L-arabino-hexul-4-ose reductase